MESNDTKQQKTPQQKVWLRDEQKTAVVRRVELHPNWGKQYLVTTHSNEWGPETYWVKEKNVEPMGAHRNG
jgi:hypothetical protein